MRIAFTHETNPKIKKRTPMMNIEITDCRLVKELISILAAIVLLIVFKSSKFEVRSSRFEVLVLYFYPPSLRFGRAGIQHLAFSIQHLTLFPSAVCRFTSAERNSSIRMKKTPYQDSNCNLNAIAGYLQGEDCSRVG